MKGMLQSMKIRAYGVSLLVVLSYNLVIASSPLKAESITLAFILMTKRRIDCRALILYTSSSTIKIFFWVLIYWGANV